MDNQFNDVMYNPLMKDYLDSLYEDSSYIIPGFIYKRVVGINFVNNNSVPNITEEFEDSTPAAISIFHTWDNSTRKVDGSVEVLFDTVPEPGDFRIGLMIAEDSVTGGSEYDQRSYFDTSSVYPELNGLGNPITGYVHFDVFRDTVFGGIDGRAGIIPQSPEVGKKYAVEFHYEVPEQYIDLDVNTEYLKLIAFVGYYYGDNLNAAEKYVTDVTDISTMPETLLNNNTIIIHRVNSKGISFFLNTPGKYAVSLYSSSGQKLDLLNSLAIISQGLNTISWNDMKLPKGIYFFHITGKNSNKTIPIIIYK